MGLFDPPKRPADIKLLNVESRIFKAMVSYKATYTGKASKNIRINVKYLNTYFAYSYGEPHITKVEQLGKVCIGLFRTDVRLLFLVKLSDGTVDLLQSKEGTDNCNILLERALDKDQPREQAAKQESTCSPALDDTIEEVIDLPIEVLPNLYSVKLSNVSLKHHRMYKNGKIFLDYVTLKCKVNYSLNGRKEGKRLFIFTSYDDRDGVLEVRGNQEKYHFTEAGHEFVSICFNNPYLTRISVSVKENS